MRNRALGLALIALAAPFPALALEGGGAEGTGSPGLSVTASLDSCGLAGAQVMCKIDAGWNTLEGAESYAVSVTAADGSVIDAGETSGQGTSVWVPYVGSGAYSVHVTAWGTPPDEEEEDGAPEVIARDSTFEGGGSGSATETPPPSSGETRDEEGAEPAVEDPAEADGEEVGEPREEIPLCEQPAQEEPPLPAEPEERAEVNADEAAAPAEPEVVDTIPADDDCTS